MGGGLGSFMERSLTLLPGFSHTHTHTRPLTASTHIAGACREDKKHLGARLEAPGLGFRVEGLVQPKGFNGNLADTSDWQSLSIFNNRN